jgi:hypothetical protein
MKGLLCLVMGHQKVLMAFTSNRFSCRRCGADLGDDLLAMPSPPAAARTHPKPRASNSLNSSLRERSLRFPLASTGKRRLHPRSRLGTGARNDRGTRNGASQYGGSWGAGSLSTAHDSLVDVSAFLDVSLLYRNPRFVH